MPSKMQPTVVGDSSFSHLQVGRHPGLPVCRATAIALETAVVYGVERLVVGDQAVRLTTCV